MIVLSAQRVEEVEVSRQMAEIKVGRAGVGVKSYVWMRSHYIQPSGDVLDIIEISGFMGANDGYSVFFRDRDDIVQDFWELRHFRHG